MIEEAHQLLQTTRNAKTKQIITYLLKHITRQKRLYNVLLDEYWILKGRINSEVE